MKVILLDNVKNLGLKYEIKTVNDGFAQNFLIPNKKAVLATDEAISRIESERQAHKEAIENQKSTLIDLLSKIGEEPITITAKATESGGLYASIDNIAIVNAIKKDHDIDIDPSHINIEQNIKETGNHTVTINIDGEKKELNIEVKPS